MIQLVISGLFLLTAQAFDGQPKTITVLPHLAQKATLELPKVELSDLVIDDNKCAEATCSKIARVQNQLKAKVENVEYRVTFAWVTVNRNGQIVQPFSTRILVLLEVETGTRLTLSFDGDRKTACFGASSPSNTCSFYSVTSTY